MPLVVATQMLPSRSSITRKPKLLVNPSRSEKLSTAGSDGLWLPIRLSGYGTRRRPLPIVEIHKAPSLATYIPSEFTSIEGPLALYSPSWEVMARTEPFDAAIHTVPLGASSISTFSKTNEFATWRLSWPFGRNTSPTLVLAHSVPRLSTKTLSGCSSG